MKAFITSVAALAAVLAALTACSAQMSDEDLADQGDAEASFRLGLRSAIGQDVLQDDAEAARWFRLAADQGHAEAQVSLGPTYTRSMSRTNISSMVTRVRGAG